MKERRIHANVPMKTRSITSFKVRDPLQHSPPSYANNVARMATTPNAPAPIVAPLSPALLLLAAGDALALAVPDPEADADAVDDADAAELTELAAEKVLALALARLPSMLEMTLEMYEAVVGLTVALATAEPVAEGEAVMDMVWLEMAVPGAPQTASPNWIAL